MEISGIKSEKVTIDVKPSEIKEAFLYLCNLENILGRNKGHWHLEDNKLVKYEDISYHGSCCWEKCSEIKDEDTVRLYILMKEVLEILDKKDVDK